MTEQDKKAESGNFVWIAPNEPPRADGGIGVSLAGLTALAGLIHEVGPGIVPKSETPLIVTVIDSNRFPDGKNPYHHVVVKMENTTLHGIYIENIEIPRGNNDGTYKVTASRIEKPKELAGMNVTPIDELIGNPPWHLRPKDKIFLRLKLPVKGLNDDIKRNPYGKLKLVYSRLEKEREEETEEIVFRIRPNVGG